jgi:NADH-quinone oxidoreductase E subunit
MLSEKSLQRIEELKKRYPSPRAVVLEALWLWQDEHRWISQEGMQTVGKLLDIPAHEVYGIVTFYTMYNSKPVGRNKLEVCTNVSCMLKNSQKIVEYLEKKLDIKVGETTPDNKVTLVEAECLGSCGTAPMLQCGDEYFENLDETKVDKILSELK